MKITESRLRQIIKEEQENMFKPDYPKEGYEGFYKESELGSGQTQYYHEHVNGLYVRVFPMASDNWQVSTGIGGDIFSTEVYETREEALEQGVFLYSEELMREQQGYNEEPDKHISGAMPNDSQHMKDLINMGR